MAEIEVFKALDAHFTANDIDRITWTPKFSLTGWTIRFYIGDRKVFEYEYDELSLWDDTPRRLARRIFDVAGKAGWLHSMMRSNQVIYHAKPIDERYRFLYTTFNETLLFDPGAGGEE